MAVSASDIRIDLSSAPRTAAAADAAARLANLLAASISILLTSYATAPGDFVPVVSTMCTPAADTAVIAAPLSTPPSNDNVCIDA
jgi:hypothetical protein